MSSLLNWLTDKSDNKAEPPIQDGTIIPGLAYLIDVYFDMVKVDDSEMARVRNLK